MKNTIRWLTAIIGCGALGIASWRLVVDFQQIALEAQGECDYQSCIDGAMTLRIGGLVLTAIAGAVLLGWGVRAAKG